MLALMWVWPRIFFPFIWISLYFILEPINIWLGNRSLAHWTQKGDWRPVIVLWLGVLLTAFFWEMWNYHAYPKWIYHVPWENGCTSSKCPCSGMAVICPLRSRFMRYIIGPVGVVGDKQTDFVKISPD